MIQTNRVIVAEYLLGVQPNNVDAYKFVARVIDETFVKYARCRGFEALAKVGIRF